MHGRALAARFEALDVNADGYLDEADYTALATRLVVASGFAVGNGVDSKVRDRYLALWETLRLAMDSDGDRRVSRAEFIAAVAAGTAGDGADFDRAVAAVASAVVDLADFDDDDRLDEAEFQKLFAALGVADIDGGQAFLDLDRDGDGYLSRKELFLALREFYSNPDPRAPGSSTLGRI